jgi:type VI protein secretion system component Hcp
VDKVFGGEAVTLNYGKIKWTYTQQNPDGSEKWLKLYVIFASRLFWRE